MSERQKDIAELQATIRAFRLLGAKVCLEFPDKITTAQRNFMMVVSPLGVADETVLREFCANAVAGFVTELLEHGELSGTDGEFVKQNADSYVARIRLGGAI